MYKNASWKARCMRGKRLPGQLEPSSTGNRGRWTTKSLRTRHRENDAIDREVRKMKKRLIALLLAFVMVLYLTATVVADGGISIASLPQDATTHSEIFRADGGGNWKTTRPA